jgi:aldehyde dehydrogenase (NAD+)
MENGKPIRESRDIDIPLAIRHFYHHAGWAQILESEFPDYSSVGICAQIIPWNFPFLMLAWKIAPALAAGNSLILKPAEQTSLTALYFAEICKSIGLPAGVVNILTGDGRTGSELIKQPEISKVAFTGSTEVGRKIKKTLAGHSKSLTLELGGKSPFIIFDDADIDSAIEGLVDAIFLNQGQVCCAGSRLLVQESIFQKVYKKLINRMKKLRLGNPLDKTIDMGAIVSSEQLMRINSLVDKGIKNGAEIFQCPLPEHLNGFFFPPTLLNNVSPSMEIFQEEIFGPVLVCSTFRTPGEAVELANNSKYGLSASIWSENINLSLDIAPKIKAGVIWINSTNMFDAAVGFGGYRESGYGREGGKEGLVEYLKKNFMAQKNNFFGKKSIDTSKTIPPNEGIIDQTKKMYIAGKQVRGDSGHSLKIFNKKQQVITNVGRGNRKDIRNAVEAANLQTKWPELSSHARSQILFYLAENLSQRREEFINLLEKTSCCYDAQLEIDTSLDRLFTFAAWADKYDGLVHQAPLRANTLAINEPIGSLGIVCPENCPLAAFVTLFASAISQGNRVIILPSETFPIPALNMYQIFDTSDLIGGVINIVTGKHEEIIPTLSEHLSVDGIWHFGNSRYSKQIEIGSTHNLKQTWVLDGNKINWLNNNHLLTKEFLRKSTQVKNIWIPYGE